MSRNVGHVSWHMSRKVSTCISVCHERYQRESQSVTKGIKMHLSLSRKVSTCICQPWHERYQDVLQYVSSQERMVLAHVCFAVVICCCCSCSSSSSDQALPAVASIITRPMTYHRGARVLTCSHTKSRPREVNMGAQVNK
jgi:hypothetical protein